MAPVRFGRFEFDPEKLELKRDGNPVRLQPQPAQVLALLLERAGETVTREELRNRVWGGGTHVDFDQGLNYCVAQIRTALGDSAESAAFVRTVPKRGYQFVAPVAPTAAAIPMAAPAKRLLPAWVPAAMVLLIAGGLLAAVVLGSRHPALKVAVIHFDNQTGREDLNAFTDGLTDMVVAQLTSDGASRYGVIGNAAILRTPRPFRDVAAIGKALDARYVVLGQVQQQPGKVRVLAHLIRVPELTHVAVARFDRDVRDPLDTESELSRLIVAEFSNRLR